MLFRSQQVVPPQLVRLKSASEDFRACTKAITLVWDSETPETWDSIKSDLVGLRRAKQGWKEVGVVAKQTGPTMRKEVQELLAFT